MFGEMGGELDKQRGQKPFPHLSGGLGSRGWDRAVIVSEGWMILLASLSCAGGGGEDLEACGSPMESCSVVPKFTVWSLGLLALIKFPSGWVGHSSLLGEGASWPLMGS